MLHDDLAEDFACLNGLQANVSADGRAHVSMTENSSNQFIFARPAHQNDGASRMPKLMCRYPQSCRFEDALGGPLRRLLPLVPAPGPGNSQSSLPPLSKADR